MNIINKNFKKVGIFGYGNMGQAILNGLMKGNNKQMSFFVYSKDYVDQDFAKSCNSMEELIQFCDIIFVCIKPQDFKNFKFSKSNELGEETIFISIMAGITIKDIELKFETKKVVRTMPNLPLQIQKGVIGWFAASNIFRDYELKELEDVLNCLGTAIEVVNEDQLNVITAISGSGPAYVFLFVDALVQASVNLGISEEDSKKIVLKTIEGSLAYIESQQQDSLGSLIKKVTSKGGTTEAAFKEIDSKQFYKTWEQGTQKAYERACELSK